MNRWTQKLARTMSLVMFVGVTLFVVRAASGCDDKKTEEGCCALDEDTSKPNEIGSADKQGAKKQLSAKPTAPGNAAGINAKPEVFIPASKAAPLPVFELKAPGFGKPNKARRPSLNVIPQQQAAPTR